MKRQYIIENREEMVHTSIIELVDWDWKQFLTERASCRKQETPLDLTPPPHDEWRR